MLASVFKDTPPHHHHHHSDIETLMLTSVQQILVVNINDKAMECPGMLAEDKVINECSGETSGCSGAAAAAAYFKSTARSNKKKLLEQQLSVQSGSGRGSSVGSVGGGVVSGGGAGRGISGGGAKKHGVEAQFKMGMGVGGPVGGVGAGHVNKRGKYSSSSVSGAGVVGVAGSGSGGKLVDSKASKSNSVPDDTDDFLDSSFEPTGAGGGAGSVGGGGASGPGAEPGAARLIKVPSEIGMDEVRSRHDGSVG